VMRVSLGVCVECVEEVQEFSTWRVVKTLYDILYRLVWADAKSRVPSPKMNFAPNMVLIH